MVFTGGNIKWWVIRIVVHMLLRFGHRGRIRRLFACEKNIITTNDNWCSRNTIHQKIIHFFTFLLALKRQARCFEIKQLSIKNQWLNSATNSMQSLTQLNIEVILHLIKLIIGKKKKFYCNDNYGLFANVLVGWVRFFRKMNHLFLEWNLIHQTSCINWFSKIFSFYLYWIKKIDFWWFFCQKRAFFELSKNWIIGFSDIFC